MVQRVGAVWRAVPAVLWSRRTWLAAAHVITGGLLWAIPMYLAIGSAGASTKALMKLDGTRHEKLFYVLSVGLPVFAVGLIVLFALTTRFTAWQRSRFRAVLGVELLPYPAHPADRRPLAALLRAASSRSTWRQVCYHVVGGAFTAVAGSAVVVCGIAGTTLAMLPFVLYKGHRAVEFLVFGAAAVLVTPCVARGAAWLDVALARALLQPSGTERLAWRVEALSASRAGMVYAADTERRRIERNLHDGTQQRLVSLAMKLGMTRAALRDEPREIREAIADAHEEAKQALAELRDFIRGLHPAILDEMGLDAALSGIAARSPVPVKLAVELGERPAVAIETIAYFVVSETLSNVARHAAASGVEVAVRQHGSQLMLSIVDDGCGGADPLRGTGLRGLRQRVESVDGTLHIASPPGGPTSITVTLPCAS